MTLRLQSNTASSLIIVITGYKRSIQWIAVLILLILSLNSEIKAGVVTWQTSAFLNRFIPQQGSPSFQYSPECLAFFPGLLTSWEKIEKEKEIPIYVISHNNPTFLKRMLFQAKCYNIPVVVVDQGSDFSVHLDFLKSISVSGVPVYYLPNLGARTLFYNFSLLESLPLFVAISDADILFNPHLPRNFLEVFANISSTYDKKVGFALGISDPRLHDGAYFEGKTIAEWEENFWKEAVIDLKPLTAYYASIDTTLAVYNTKRIREKNTCLRDGCSWHEVDAIRVGANFTAEHTPWLKDFSRLWDVNELNASYGMLTAKRLTDLKLLGSTTGLLLRNQGYFLH